MSIGIVIPSVLFNIHLKDLKPAEIKVLLTVIYQAYSSGNPLQCYWISGEQLKNKTGCSRRAISSAIGSLVQRGLIVVTDRQRNILRESVRRKGKTKLFFRLSPFLSIG